MVSGKLQREEPEVVPEEFRCKRSDGKQWRCSARSMPDKTVCEKHYFQAKRRATNPSTQTNQKKMQRREEGGEVVPENKKNEVEEQQGFRQEFSTVLVTKKSKSKGLVHATPPLRIGQRKSKLMNDEAEIDKLRNHGTEKEPDMQLNKVHKTPSRTKTAKDLTSRPLLDCSTKSTGTLEKAERTMCHQCQKNGRGRVVRCSKCKNNHYCIACITRWYPKLREEDIEKTCPVCCGKCNCKACLCGNGHIKVPMQETDNTEKIQYLHYFLFMFLPVIKEIHKDQCLEQEIEAKIQGEPPTKLEIPRTKFNSDERLYCDNCKTTIVDYYRNCPYCSYDLCLSCCQELREGFQPGSNKSDEALQHSTDAIDSHSKDGILQNKQSKLSDGRAGCELLSQATNSSTMSPTHRSPDNKTISDGSIPCPSKECGGSDKSLLKLNRLFKMNWVAKLVKNAEEMASSCKFAEGIKISCPCTSCFKVGNNGCPERKIHQAAHRNDGNGNVLYSPTAQDINEGLEHFQKHWFKAEPVIVKNVKKMALYAVSSAVKEIQRLTLDPKILCLGVENTNLTSLVSENIARMNKRKREAQLN